MGPCTDGAHDFEQVQLSLEVSHVDRRALWGPWLPDQEGFEVKAASSSPDEDAPFPSPGHQVTHRMVFACHPGTREANRPQTAPAFLQESDRDDSPSHSVNTIPPTPPHADSSGSRSCLGELSRPPCLLEPS